MLVHSSACSPRVAPHACSARSSRWQNCRPSQAARGCVQPSARRAEAEPRTQDVEGGGTAMRQDGRDMQWRRPDSPMYDDDPDRAHLTSAAPCAALLVRCRRSINARLGTIFILTAAQGAGCSRPGARLPAKMLRPVDAIADSAARPRPGGGGGRAACPPTPLRARAQSQCRRRKLALRISSSTRLTSGMSRISLRKHSHSLFGSRICQCTPGDAVPFSRTRAQP